MNMHDLRNRYLAGKISRIDVVRTLCQETGMSIIDSTDITSKWDERALQAALIEGVMMLLVETGNEAVRQELQSPTDGPQRGHYHTLAEKLRSSLLKTRTALQRIVNGICYKSDGEACTIGLACDTCPYEVKHGDTRSNRT